MDIKYMIEAVRGHARKHYNEGGWDIVVESYEDDELKECIEEAGASSVQAAIDAVGRVVGLVHSVQEDRAAFFDS